MSFIRELIHKRKNKRLAKEKADENAREIAEAKLSTRERNNLKRDRDKKKFKPSPGMQNFG